MKVPFVDLHSQYLTIKPEIDEAISTVIRESSFIRGRHVDEFERAFAVMIGVQNCISCGNGTDALYIALKSLGVQMGDEVITTAHSWISTSETITQAGGRVVFCDTDRHTFTIDPRLIEEKITVRTRGIIPVHLYGQPADMDPIMEIARRHQLWVIEDCAQAHFARYRGKYVGTFGIAATFSFYPGKNLGAMGDAGCIVTNDSSLATQMAMFARHGGLMKGDHQIEGINSRMDGLQAAILNVKLRHIQEWTRRRQAAADSYASHLAGIPDLTLPSIAQGREHVFHLYVVRTAVRDELQSALRTRGVETVINYPTALPFLPAYRYLGHRPMDFPAAFDHQSRILSLPIYPELTEALAAEVAATVRLYFEEAKPTH